MFDTERFRSAESDTEGIIRLTGASPLDRVLDMGCGPGRHSKELARRGLEVTGVDINPAYLEQAEQECRRLSRPPEFINCDMREFLASRPFDGALSLFQSLGYFDNPEDDMRTCRNICRGLKPGGWFLVEMDGKEALAASFEERTWLERDGRLILLEYAVEGAWDRLWNHWQFRDRNGRWHEFDFSYRLYSAVELGMMLEKAGFSSIEFFGDFNGSPYNHCAKRLIALARKDDNERSADP